MGFAESGESVCPIAQTLAMVGERWTMLILRELFMGSKRFDEFQMYTDMSPHLLSTRLKGLEADGIINRKQYQDRPPRFEYTLTTKGADLYPLILSLKSFGDKWAKYKSRGKASVTLTHTGCGHTTVLKMKCSACDEPFGTRDTVGALSKEFASERQDRKASFLEKQRRKQATAVA